jgi:hypothetical protein
MNPLLKLPNEIIDEIFNKLDPADKQRFQQSSHYSEQDPNVKALNMTRQLTKLGMPIRREACNITAAVIHMGLSGSTEMMDPLLEAGAKLDLPVHAELNPLVVYAEISKEYDNEGYDYLFSHGATVQPSRHSDKPGEDYKIPIYRLWHSWHGRDCLLDDVRFKVLKLFIERRALRNIAVRFVKNDFRQPTSTDGIPSLKRKMEERSRMILKLILRDCNFETTMAQEMESLFQELVEPSGKTSSNSIIDPILKDMLMPYVKRSTQLEKRIVGE